jgi:hypothetical protein
MDITDTIGENVERRDMALWIAAENKGGARGAIEFVTLAWLKHRWLLPVQRHGELAVFDRELVFDLELAALVDSTVLREIFGRGIDWLKSCESLRSAIPDLAALNNARRQVIRLQSRRIAPVRSPRNSSFDLGRRTPPSSTPPSAGPYPSG